MSRPTPATVAAAVGGGLANAGFVLALYARADYPALESTTATALLVATAFAVGFAAAAVSAHTRLLAPAGVVVAVAALTAFLELTTPSPEWGELGGYVVVDGPTHVGGYANAWFLWLAFAAFAGVVEFAIRRGYGIGGRRLRDLPSLPLSRAAVGRTVAAVAGLIGAATTALVIQQGIGPSVAAVAVLIGAVAVAAVPLAALLSRGSLAPLVLFALAVPYSLGIEVFSSTDSPVHILLFGPYAVVLAVVWALESRLRGRRGWDGGRHEA